MRLKPERALFLVPDEFRRLLGGAKGLGQEAHRDRNYILFLLAGNLGLRVSETVSLRIRDFHLGGEHPFLRVQTKKQKAAVENDLPLNLKLVGPIAAYLTSLGGRAKRRYHATNGYVSKNRSRLCLFPGPSAIEPMSSRQAQKLFKRAASAAGLDARYSFHSLRHFRGMQLYQATKNLNAVQKFMRHRNLSSTFVYQHLDPEEASAANARTKVIV